jgi:hypothetical protein
VRVGEVCGDRTERNTIKVVLKCIVSDALHEVGKDGRPFVSSTANIVDKHRIFHQHSHKIRYDRATLICRVAVKVASYHMDSLAEISFNGTADGTSRCGVISKGAVFKASHTRSFHSKQLDRPAPAVAPVVTSAVLKYNVGKRNIVVHRGQG